MHPTTLPPRPSVVGDSVLRREGLPPAPPIRNMAFATYTAPIPVIGLTPATPSVNPSTSFLPIPSEAVTHQSHSPLLFQRPALSTSPEPLLSVSPAPNPSPIPTHTTPSPSTQLVAPPIVNQPAILPISPSPITTSPIPTPQIPTPTPENANDSECLSRVTLPGGEGDTQCDIPLPSSPQNCAFVPIGSGEAYKGGSGCVPPNVIDPIRARAKTPEAELEQRSKNIIKPAGKDYFVDLTYEGYPAILRGGRKFTSVGGEVFNLPDRFSICSSLGNGAYSTVVSAKDHKCGGEVAIKKCAYVFSRPEDGKRLLREVKLMKGLRHKNIISLNDILIPLEDEFNDLYFVVEKMDIDLYHYQRKSPLNEYEAKEIFYQVLQGMYFVHSAHVVHRDLKPDNILLRHRDGAVKLCDFNLSRGCDPDQCEPMTQNISTRWYRSPELLLDSKRYFDSVDVWSLGCIFAEMCTGITMFQGDSQMEMIDKIISTIHVDIADTEWIESEDMREKIKATLLEKGSTDRLDSLIPIKSALPIIRKMLQFNPSKRASVSELLCDPYFRDVCHPECTQKSTHVFKWKYDDLKPTGPMLRKLFWYEIVSMHPEIMEHRTA